MHWSRDEIAKAFTLRYFSKRAYLYVKDELHYPLPGKKHFLFNIFVDDSSFGFYLHVSIILGLSSLQRWVKTIHMRNGILQDVLKIMKLNGDTLNDQEKLTVLMFDEVKISSTMEYDVLHDLSLIHISYLCPSICS